MSFTKIWIHCVWTTKDRKTILEKEIRPEIFAHIKENAKTKGIYMDCINGYADHVHILIDLARDMTLSKTIQLIKGESSHWINKNNMTDEKFSWQDDYYAASVSHSQVTNVRNYIYNQEEHHKQVSTKEEIELLLKKLQITHYL